MAKVFTLAEVAEHNTRNDCWLSVFGRVYNVTNFLDEHPGGDEVLLKSTGKDATGDFLDVGHTHDAWAMLEKFYVGEINKETIPTNKTTIPVHPINEKKGKKKNYIIYFIQFLVPLIILNVIIAFFSKSPA